MCSNAPMFVYFISSGVRRTNLVTLCLGNGRKEEAFMADLAQRRRIKTDEKAKVVAAVWGTELIQFLAALDILHQDVF